MFEILVFKTQLRKLSYCHRFGLPFPLCVDSYWTEDSFRSAILFSLALFDLFFCIVKRNIGRTMQNSHRALRLLYGQKLVMFRRNIALPSLNLDRRLFVAVKCNTWHQSTLLMGLRRITKCVYNVAILVSVVVYSLGVFDM